MVSKEREHSYKIKDYCLKKSAENLGDREYDQILDCAEKIPIPIIRYDTITKMAKIVCGYSIERALFTIRRQAMCLYFQAQAEIAYQVAKNGNVDSAKMLCACILDEEMKRAALENINEI